MVRIIDSIASLCLRHSKAIAIVWLLAAAASAAVATRIEFAPETVPGESQHVVRVERPEVLQAIAGGFRLSSHAGEVRVAQESVVVTPKQPPRDVAFARELLAEAALIEARALKEFQKAAPAGVALPVIEESGGYRFVVEQADLARRNLATTTLVALLAVLALIAIVFRRHVTVTCIAATVVASLAITFGLVALLQNPLTGAAAGFGGLVAAVSGAFAALLYWRFLRERRDGAPAAEGLIRATRGTLPAIATTGLLIAIVCYAIRSPFGSLAGTGILVSALATSLLLPSLIALAERPAPRR